MTFPERTLGGTVRRVCGLTLVGIGQALHGCAAQERVAPGAVELTVRSRSVIVPADAADGSADGLAAVSSLAVLDAGTVAVFDPTSGLVSVFDRQGARLATFGGRGDGPGEFRGRAELRAMPGGNILAWDEAAGRVSEFEADGELVRTTPLQSGSMLAGRDLTVLDDGGFALRGPSGDPDQGRPHRRYAYRVFDRTHVTRNPLEVPESGPWAGLSPFLTLPFTPHLLSTPARGGGLHLADSGRYVVYRIDSAGAVVDSITRPAAPLELLSAERENYQAFVDARLGEGAPEIPTTKPILRDLWTACDGTLVLALHGAGISAPTAEANSRVTGLPTIQWSEEQVLDFFDPSGRLLGRLDLSPGIRLLDVHFPEIWVARFDAFDRPSIEVWKLGKEALEEQGA